MGDEGEGEGRLDGGYAYRAFISYSHRDQAAVRRLHRALESYRIPTKFVGTETAVGKVPRRLRPIFRDREELPASANLGSELGVAIRQSMFLIVVCSPGSAKSHWVDQEILQFKQAHGEGRVLALIVDGEPHASDIPGREDEECFPPNLRFHIGADGQISDVPAEPIAADIRKDADGPRLAAQKLIAGLTGLRLDDLVQRETQRRMQRMAIVTAGAMTGMVVTGGLAFYANAARVEANTQRVIAQREAAAARAASDYLVGTFELSNPATENPRTITALTILGRSADRARLELADQPQIQVRLLATLARAYNNLGLLSEARTAIESALPTVQKTGPDGAEAMLVLATTYLKQGSLDQAKYAVRQAESMLGPDLKEHTALRAQAALTEGRILTSLADVRAGVAAFDRALAFYKASDNPSPVALAMAYNNRGIVLSDDGQFAAAEASLTEALHLYQRTRGETHLSTGRTWYALAQNAFNKGDLPLAKQRVVHALKIERAVLDANNPILAETLSMQGQIQQGMGDLESAERSLREAVATYRSAYDGPHYTIGMADVYLGLIEADQGKFQAALATLDDAKRNYDASYGRIHANHGDLLVNRATVLAKAGRMAEARTDCADGVQILRQTLGADAYFTKSMTATCKGLKAGPSRP